MVADAQVRDDVDPYQTSEHTQIERAPLARARAISLARSLSICLSIPISLSFSIPPSLHPIVANWWGQNSTCQDSHHSTENIWRQIWIPFLNL